MMTFKRIPLATVLCFMGIHLTAMAVAKPSEPAERHLGPTGLFGRISAKDIRITKVTAGSPADGRIKEGDVIVGAGGIGFGSDTRRQLADAIDLAETDQAKGLLVLTMKDGRKVELHLKVAGSYSDTTPLNCPKTDAIITRTAEALAKSKGFGSHNLPIDLLGLLATGEAKYIDAVKKEVHKAKWAAPDVKPTLSPASSAWSYGYTTLFLCEYYLATGDQFVLPAIEAYAVTLAMGRDAAGLWGHRMADPAANRGQLHGRLFGYAVMNQSSLPCYISLLLAEKCGIKHPEVQAAIKQTGTFYDSYVNKGTLPYGVHDPNSKAFNNNGMSGLAAVAMSLRGNKEGAAFFSRMSLAAHDTMESGHTGHYFNQLWTGLGAGLAGPEAAAAFFRKTRWLHTLNRTWDDGFIYDGGESNYSYRGLSDAGSHLLNHCLARRKLFITGRDADSSIWLKGREVADTVEWADFDPGKKSDEELLALFGHPMPKIRGEAVWTMRGRKHDLLEKIVAMTGKGTMDQRLSAIGYFGYQCPPDHARAAFNNLCAILRDPAGEMEVRAAAAESLCSAGEAAYPVYDDILRLVLVDKPDDPLGRVDEKLGRGLNSLCANPHAAGLVKDKKLFYGVVCKLLGHKRANGRAAGGKLVSGMPLEDFVYVGDKLSYVLADQDLTYHSYHNLNPQIEVISILGNLRIEGGIDAAFRIQESETGKAGFKIRMLMDVLPKYGSNARYLLPKLREMKAGKFQKSWDEMLKNIESADGPPVRMMTFDEAMKAGRKR